METLSVPPSGSVYVNAGAVIYAVEKIETFKSLLDPLWLAPSARCGRR